MRRNVDLHLLECLDTLMTERQVTRAAERMGMSQSAMSNALGRLRVLFNDPLLVRTSRGMIPTSRALELVEGVRTGLRHIDDALTRSAPFDPAVADLTVRIMTTDYAAEMLMPAFLGSASTLAPNFRVEVRNMDPSRVREELEEGSSHLVIGYFRDLPQDFYSSVILTDKIVCLARSRHPSLGRGIDLAEYARLAHACFAGFSHAGLSTIEKVTDAALADFGLKRRVVFQAGSVSVLLSVVAETDLIATVPLGSVQHATKGYRLKVAPLPFAVPSAEIALIWHERTHRDAAHGWFRNAIRGVAKRWKLSQGDTEAAAAELMR